MPETFADITKIDIRDGRIHVHLVDRLSRAESFLSLTAASAEIYAREILDAVRALDRQSLENLIGSLRRQAQQVQASLDRAERQLADFGASSAPPLSRIAIVADTAGDGFIRITPGEKVRVSSNVLMPELSA